MGQKLGEWITPRLSVARLGREPRNLILRLTAPESWSIIYIRMSGINRRERGRERKRSPSMAAYWIRPTENSCGGVQDTSF